MPRYSRYAIYCLPDDEALADFGARWLGWDLRRGCDAPEPYLTGLDELTQTPRKYGFHATLKPPFRLAEGMRPEDLSDATEALAAITPAAQADGLALTLLGDFFALTPIGDASAIARVAKACVTELDHFRAPASGPELARRRQAGLSPRQEALLRDWGYPYVLDQFRFHFTLTGHVDESTKGAVRSVIEEHLPDLPTPFVVNRIALCGEREDSRFELIRSYSLAG